MSAAARLDLHVHSRHSPDSDERVEAIAARASAMGLRGFALTDHNTVAGHAELRALAPRWPALVLVPGVEVSTREGHLLLLGVGEAPAPYLPIDEVLDWARSRGAVPVIAHPFRFFHGVGGAVASRAAVPALETRNGHNPTGANRRAQALASARRLGSTGGSDAHRADEVGRCTTEFAASVGSVEEVLAELAAGRTTAAGTQLTPSEVLRLALRNFGRRLARGLRPI
jgi:predicted metal-dependent phosphoesterase TrpH